jgi:hypothetical protein
MSKILKKDLTKEAFCENRAKYSFGEVETKSEASNPLAVYSIVTETIRSLVQINLRIGAIFRPFSLIQLDSFLPFRQKTKRLNPAQKEW